MTVRTNWPNKVVLSGFKPGASYYTSLDGTLWGTMHADQNGKISLRKGHPLWDHIDRLTFEEVS